MTTKLKINDLIDVKDMGSNALSAVHGGLAEQFLFRSQAPAAHTSIINQFFDYGVHNYSYQDDRDVIYADGGATVLNIGGNSNVSMQSRITASIQTFVAQEMPGLIDAALQG